jgi:hypothetical protein
MVNTASFLRIGKGWERQDGPRGVMAQGPRELRGIGEQIAQVRRQGLAALLGGCIAARLSAVPARL